MARASLKWSAAAWGIAAALGSSAARAQEAPSAANAANAPETVGIEEIVVTAQHRSENLQNVPVAISAVTAGTLLQSGIGSTASLPQIIPSVQFARSGPSGLFFLRGVGQSNAASGEEGANAIYVDGVYMPDLGQTVNYFNNIERVEVLKGPQGTLFGRNATGGLINIITRDPGRDLVVKGQAGFANYDTVSGQAYVSAPLGESVSADLALTGSHQGQSWGRNLTTGADNARAEYWGARSKIVLRPSDTLKFIIGGDYFHDKDSTVLAYDFWPGQVGTGGFTAVPGRDNRSDIAPITKREIWGVSLTGDLELGFANLTSISAYRKNETRSLIDFDNGPLPLLTVELESKTTSFQQEVRLVSKDTEPLAWQIGGFYLYSKATNLQSQVGSLFTSLGIRGALIDAALKTNSYAGFGEATYSVTPTTHITGGVRFTRDEKLFTGGRSFILPTGALGPQVTQANPRLTYSQWTWRASIRQEITDDINAYASVNRGFKAGLFSLQGPTDPPVAPQFITAYEVGLKSQLFDRRLRLNIAAYHYDISDLQVRSGAGAAPGTSVLLNAAKVKVDGLEAEFDAAPVENLRIFGGFNILKSKFDTFGGPGAAFQSPIVYPNYAPVATTCPAALIGTKNPGVIGAGAPSGGLTTCYGSVAGNYTPLAPKFAASLGASLTIPLDEDSSLILNGLYSYNSGYYFEPDNVFKQASFSLFNASAELKMTKNWSVEVWGKNLANKTYAALALSSATGTNTILAPPRTFGLNAKFAY